MVKRTKYRIGRAHGGGPRPVGTDWSDWFSLVVNAEVALPLGTSQIQFAEYEDVAEAAPAPKAALPLPPTHREDLRDRAALAALTGLTASDGLGAAVVAQGEVGGGRYLDRLTRASYQLADALLRARDATPS